MHQSFEFIEDRHISNFRIIDDVMAGLPAMEKAANLMARKLCEGKVVLLGDVLVDVPSYKVSHRDPFPNPNGEMDLFSDSREIVKPFDFDKYNGIKR